MENHTRKAEPEAPEDYSQSLKSNGICLVGRTSTLLETSNRFFLLLSPLLNGNTITIIFCLPHQCVLEAYDLFSSFTGTQMEKNFA